MAYGSEDRFVTKSNCLKLLRTITGTEKYLAQAVWKEVEQSYNDYGRLSFIRLFDLYPSYKRFFMELTGNDDPFNSEKFKKHMLHVLLPTWGGLINHLDNTEAIFEALKRLGINHKKMEIGLARENVEHLGECVLCVFKQNLKTYNDEQEKALKKIIPIIIDLFCSSLEGKTI